MKSYLLPATIRQSAAICILIGILNVLFAEGDESAAMYGLAGSAIATETENPLGLKTNPALLGMEKTPIHGLIVPGFSSFRMEYWSDHLALTPYRELFLLGSDSTLLADYVDVLLEESFRTGGLSPEEASDKIMDAVENGVNIYAGVRFSLMSLQMYNMALTVDTRMDMNVYLPGDVFALIFGDDQGLVPGNVLDVSDAQFQAMVYTTISGGYGQAVKNSSVISMPGRLTNGFFDFTNGFWGVGIDYLIGHTWMRERTLNGLMSVSRTDTGDVLAIDGKMEFMTAGAGFHGDWEISDGTSPASFFTGHGLALNFGMFFSGPKTSLGIAVNNLGFIKWNDVKKAVYYVRDSSVDLQHLTGTTLFGGDDAEEGDEYTVFDASSSENDTLLDVSDVYLALPANLNIGAGYTFKFDKKNKNIRTVSNHIAVTLNYEQNFTKWPGCSYVPRFGLGIENGTFFGYMPVRIGFFAGGSQRYGSSFGIGCNIKTSSLDLGYTAYGHPFFYPKHGFGIAMNASIAFGSNKDIDKDGVKNNTDQAPQIPEDKDGYQDDDGAPDYDNDGDGIADTVDSCMNIAEDLDGVLDNDGCPDYDNDSDGVADTVDLCMNVAEDKDGYQDTDGCPDNDNDGDGIADSSDSCKNIAEDFDNFQDSDGCLDSDNDRDGIADADDACPESAENKDGFKDTDGCPDYDHDNDNIADSIDKCPEQAEIYNNFNDSDGCPDTLVLPSEPETKTLAVKLKAINFETGSATLTLQSYEALNFVADFARKYRQLRFEIQGHTDSSGIAEKNLLLSAARAFTVRNYLLSKGAADTSLISVGYGSSQPVADNKTQVGRAQNRRVEFKAVETVEQYMALRRLEMELQEKLNNRVIDDVNEKKKK